MAISLWNPRVRSRASVLLRHRSSLSVPVRRWRHSEIERRGCSLEEQIQKRGEDPNNDDCGEVVVDWDETCAQDKGERRDEYVRGTGRQGSKEGAQANPAGFCCWTRRLCGCRSHEVSDEVEEQQANST